MPRRSFQTLMKRGSNEDIRDSGEASRLGITDGDGACLRVLRKRVGQRRMLARDNPMLDESPVHRSRARLRKREIDGAGLFRKCGSEDIPRRREDIAAAPPFD